MRSILIALAAFVLCCPLWAADDPSPLLGFAPAPFNAGAATLTGGTIDNVVIGGTTPAAGSFTTVNTSGVITANLAAGGRNNLTVDCVGTAGAPVGIQFNDNGGSQFQLQRDLANQLTITDTVNSLAMCTWSHGTAATAFFNWFSTKDATTTASAAYVIAGGVGAAKNVLSGEGVHGGVTLIVTAAGTTTLTSASTGYQSFTGSTTQSVTLPAAALFGANISVHYTIDNESSGVVTLNRAGADTINTAATTLAVSAASLIDIYSDGVSHWRSR